MGEKLVMEVETGEIKATHAETTVAYTSKPTLKLIKAHRHTKKKKKNNPHFSL